MESNEARQVVQKGLDQQREDQRRQQEEAEERFHKQDMEAVGVVAGKHDRERLHQEEEAKRRVEAMEESRRQFQAKVAEERRQAEAYKEEKAECRHDIHQAAGVAGVLCAIGGLYLIGAWRPEVAMTTGGIFLLGGMTVIGIGILRWRSL